MYAIMKTGGKQYRVAEGDILSVEKLEGEAGDKVNFGVIFMNDGKNAIVDEDKLAKASVEAEIVEQYRDRKVVVFKFKKRKNYRRKRGHRQMLTKIKITKVDA